MPDAAHDTPPSPPTIPPTENFSGDEEGGRDVAPALSGSRTPSGKFFDQKKKNLRALARRQIGAPMTRMSRWFLTAPNPKKKFSNRPAPRLGKKNTQKNQSPLQKKIPRSLSSKLSRVVVPTPPARSPLPSRLFRPKRTNERTPATVENPTAMTTKICRKFFLGSATARRASLEATFAFLSTSSMVPSLSGPKAVFSGSSPIVLKDSRNPSPQFFSTPRWFYTLAKLAR